MIFPKLKQFVVKYPESLQLLFFFSLFCSNMIHTDLFVNSLKLNHSIRRNSLENQIPNISSKMLFNNAQLCVCVSFILFSSDSVLVLEQKKKKPAKINLKLVNSNHIPFYICFESYFQLEHSLLLIICEQCFDFIFNLFLISFHHFARSGCFFHLFCVLPVLWHSLDCAIIFQAIFFFCSVFGLRWNSFASFFFVLFCQHFIFNHLFFCFIWLLLWWCESAHFVFFFFFFFFLAVFAPFSSFTLLEKACNFVCN